MFRSLRTWSGELLGALQALVILLQHVSLLLEDVRQGKHESEAVARLATRVGELELSRSLHEAQMEAELLKAVNERKQARAAEERAKYAARRLGGDEESEGELPAGYRELLRGGDGNGGETAGVPDVRPPMGTTRAERKARATRMKFGG